MAEEPLLGGGSCNLGSLNLAEFVDNQGNFDFDGLSDAVYIAVIALNKVLDEGLPLHPLQEQRDSVRDWRQIGLGIFGLADMLIKVGVRYGSNESIELCKSIAYCILNSAIYASANLAALNGKTFPMYNYEQLSKSKFFIENISEENKEYVKKYGLYNSQLLTIAPTGTLSSMIGCSGGIEPIFANYYERKTESLYGEDKYFKVYTPIVKKYMDEHNLSDDSELPDYFITSANIDPIERINMQSIWQHYIDASISSTVNLPQEATIDDVANIYLSAYKAGLKGITVFRNGCRRAGILTVDTSKKKEKKNEDKEEIETTDSTSNLPRGYIIETRDNLIGKKRKLQTGCGSLHVEAFFDPITGDLMETFLSRGSTGGCANSYTGLSRMISLAARAGVGIDAIVDQLNSCGVCPSYAVRRATKHDTSPGASCPIAIGKALKEMQDEMYEELHGDINIKQQIEDTEPIMFDPKGVITACPECEDVCPECGQPLIHSNGCIQCTNCAWSKCN